MPMSKKVKKKNSKEFRDRFQKRFFTRSSTLALIIGVLVLVIAVCATFALKGREARLDENIAELNEDIKTIEGQNQELEDEKQDLETDSFKEKIAREVLGMIGKDEYLLQEREDSGEDGTTKKKSDTGKSYSGQKK